MKQPINVAERERERERDREREGEREREREKEKERERRHPSSDSRNSTWRNKVDIFCNKFISLIVVHPGLLIDTK